MSVEINPTKRSRPCNCDSVSCRWDETNSDYTSRIFKFIKKLKIGSLFKCKLCNNHWYLDEKESCIIFVSKTRLKLILEWNASSLSLNTEQILLLKKIGRTPLANTRDGKRLYYETPCKVFTKKGEIFNFAIITQQRHAPFEKHRNYKLASEIHEIQPSPFSLSLEVRNTTAYAESLRSGFAPTVVEKHNGQLMVFNGAENFYDLTDCLASDIKVMKDFYYWYDSSDVYKINIYHMSTEVTYFIADC